MFFCVYYYGQRKVVHEISEFEFNERLIRKVVKQAYRNHGIETVKHYCEDENSKYVTFYIYEVSEKTKNNFEFVKKFKVEFKGEE